MKSQSKIDSESESLAVDLSQFDLSCFIPLLGQQYPRFFTLTIESTPKFIEIGAIQLAAWFGRAVPRRRDIRS